MPVTVPEIDSRYRTNWAGWPVPIMPDISDEPWFSVQLIDFEVIDQ